MPIRRLAVVSGAMALAFPAFAAGIDSRTYSCAGLHSLVAARGFVFIGNPDFLDFVVADASSCPGGNTLEARSVPTSDNPECIVNYCVSHTTGGD